jgi:hypothetical protein
MEGLWGGRRVSPLKETHMDQDSIHSLLSLTDIIKDFVM